jgi:hypothetical protein
VRSAHRADTHRCAGGCAARSCGMRPLRRSQRKTRLAPGFSSETVASAGCLSHPVGSRWCGAW